MNCCVVNASKTLMVEPAREIDPFRSAEEELGAMVADTTALPVPDDGVNVTPGMVAVAVQVQAGLCAVKVKVIGWPLVPVLS